ncbi:hypothetical protein M885DRAFT_574525 [Pelagophyceae sp. CCMP2097]|nr:hypothetical protein M885DRAFT_574525 [Pelagophyceae sp. CCMP2097]
MNDVLALTGVSAGPGKGLAHLPPRQRAAFQSVMLEANATGCVTAEMAAMWQTVCDGGVNAPRHELIAAHKHAVENQQKQEQTPGTVRTLSTVGDELSEANVCDAPVESLRPIVIADLEVDHVHVGCVLWVTLAVDATKFTSVSAVVDDDEGGSTMLYMYNVLRPDASRAEVEAKFPQGLRLAVKQPYYKVMGTGLRALRVDNPCNVARATVDKTAADKAEPRIAADAATAADAGDPAADDEPRTAAAGNFVGPVEVVLIEGRMRGLVTTREVRRGEVLIRERAIVSANAPSGERHALAADGKSASKGSAAELLPALVSALQGDALLRARVACLYYGSPRSDVPDVALFGDGASVDQVPQISASRATRVLHLNGFRSRPGHLKGDGNSDEGSALFPLCAFMNHSSVHAQNTVRGVVDHTMTVVARCDLEAGAELTTYYFPDGGNADPALAESCARYGIPEP